MKSYKNDKKLIKHLKKGKPKAYSVIVDRYHHLLCSYAFSLARNHDQAEDVVQNVFVSLWNFRNNLKDDFLVESYLYQSVYNEFIDQYRKQKSVLAVEKKYFEKLSYIIEQPEENNLQQLIQIVNKEIENLPPKCKQTFLLSKKEGLTNMEISDYLNISLKTVEAHISKAFNLLRKALGDFDVVIKL